MTRSPEPSATSREDGAHAQPKGRSLALTVLLLPTALTLMSVTSNNVALPSIREGLGAGPVEQTLILTSYTIAFALVLPPAGRLGDRYGHKRVFIVGVAVFTIASAWCALAPDPTQLILGRVLSGIAGGLVLTPLNALIQLLYSGRERARPFAIMGAVFGAASAVGPMLGGLLLEVGGESGWHLVFWVNVPFGVGAAIAATLVIPRGTPLGVRGRDPLHIGIAAVVLPFSLGRGATAVNLGVLALGLALLAGFALWERWRERRERFAIVPLRLFRQRALPIGIVTTFLGFAAFTASFLMLALRRFGVRTVTFGLALAGGSLAVVGMLLAAIIPFDLYREIVPLLEDLEIARIARARLGSGETESLDELATELGVALPRSWRSSSSRLLVFSRTSSTFRRSRCGKLYFDEDPRNQKPNDRLVYRSTPDEATAVSVQAVAVGERFELDAYLRAQRNLERDGA